METVCRGLGISPLTYYRWRNACGGMRIDRAKRLVALEKESVRLEPPVADRALNIQILKEAAEGNCRSPSGGAGASRTYGRGLGSARGGSGARPGPLKLPI